MTYWSYWSLPGLAVGGGGRKEGGSQQRESEEEKVFENYIL